MTLKIDREILGCSPEAFASVVDAHIAALREYDAHLKGVREDAANEALAPEERRVAFPGPEAAPLVERAIKRTLNPDGESWSFEPDYELVGPSLDERKRRLLHEIEKAEMAEVAKVDPPAKQRYHVLRERSILTADAERLQAHMAVHGELPGDIEAFHQAHRPAEDTNFLAAAADRRDRRAAVEMWSAKAMHDVDDLTEATIGAWELKPFNG